MYVLIDNDFIFVGAVPVCPSSRCRGSARYIEGSTPVMPFLVSTRWGSRHPLKLISMVTVISVSLGARALAEIYIMSSPYCGIFI